MNLLLPTVLCEGRKLQASELFFFSKTSDVIAILSVGDVVPSPAEMTESVYRSLIVKPFLYGCRGRLSLTGSADTPDHVPKWEMPPHT